jgi:hypothetical protein
MLYKIVNIMLIITSLIMIEIMINSSLFGQVINMGVWFVAGLIFVINILIAIFLDINFLIKGYKVKKYIWFYGAALLVVIGLYILGILYPPTISMEAIGYIQNPTYYNIQPIFFLLFFMSIIFKSIMSLMLRIK